MPASSDDPLRGFLKFLNIAVHLVPLAAPRLRRLPPIYAADGDTVKAWDRPDVQHCCDADDNGSIIAARSPYAVFPRVCSLLCVAMARWTVRVAVFGEKIVYGRTTRKRADRLLIETGTPQPPAKLRNEFIETYRQDAAKSLCVTKPSRFVRYIAHVS